MCMWGHKILKYVQDMHIATHPYPCLTSHNATAGSLWEFVGVSAPNGYKVTVSCHAMYTPHTHYTDYTDSEN